MLQTSATLHFFAWLILGGPYPVLVDTGFRQEDAAERGVANFVSPAAMVEKLGVKAADIPTALITHLHWDHWAGHSLFPAAEFWIQKEEIAFWTGPVARCFPGSACAGWAATRRACRSSPWRRPRAGFDTIHALAGDRSRIVTGHDPEVAERFKPVEPGVVQIA
jgi:glyoxylase-like metal-dependent hydrolase (beta-lactamase superfamily II)